jgi:hypothetical protein
MFNVYLRTLIPAVDASEIVVEAWFSDGIKALALKIAPSNKEATSFSLVILSIPLSWNYYEF